MADIVNQKDLHRITITATIYNSDGKYLIIKRPDGIKVYPSKWCVPGGGLEINDYLNKPKTPGGQWQYILEDTLRREIKEEVGLDIGKLKYLRDVIFIRPDGIPVVVLSFYAPFVSGEVVLAPTEAVDYAWINADEADKYDLIDGIGNQIKQADEELKSKE